jgi:hypothetical protein
MGDEIWELDVFLLGSGIDFTISSTMTVSDAELLVLSPCIMELEVVTPSVFLVPHPMSSLLSHPLSFLRS